MCLRDKGFYGVFCSQFYKCSILLSCEVRVCLNKKSAEFIIAFIDFIGIIIHPILKGLEVFWQRNTFFACHLFLSLIEHDRLAKSIYGSAKATSSLTEKLTKRNRPTWNQLFNFSEKWLQFGTYCFYIMLKNISLNVEKRFTKRVFCRYVNK